jgi:DNA-directed RNA polymerase alpha subunit
MKDLVSGETKIIMSYFEVLGKQNNMDSELLDEEKEKGQHVAFSYQKSVLQLQLSVTSTLCQRKVPIKQRVRLRIKRKDLQRCIFSMTRDLLQNNTVVTSLKRSSSVQAAWQHSAFT